MSTIFKNILKYSAGLILLVPMTFAFTFILILMFLIDLIEGRFYLSGEIWNDIRDSWRPI